MFIVNQANFSSARLSLFYPGLWQPSYNSVTRSFVFFVQHTLYCYETPAIFVIAFMTLSLAILIEGFFMCMIFYNYSFFHFVLMKVCYQLLNSFSSTLQLPLFNPLNF